MTDTDKGPRPSRTGFVVGLVLGLVLGLAAGALVGRRQAADPWIDAGAVWLRLPGRAPAGALPQTFAVPAKAYDYGAATEPLGPLVVSEPAILRLDLETTAGRVGAALVTPDGARLLSKEKVLTPKDGEASAYFSLTPALGPVIVVLRNYDNAGVSGAVTVRGVRFVRQSTLSSKAMGEISRKGVN